MAHKSHVHALPACVVPLRGLAAGHSLSVPRLSTHATYPCPARPSHVQVWTDYMKTADILVQYSPAEMLVLGTQWLPWPLSKASMLMEGG